MGAVYPFSRGLAYNLATVDRLSFVPVLLYRRQWMNRWIPTTWVLYGLGVSQLGDLDNPMVYAGRRTTVSQLLSSYFG